MDKNKHISVIIPAYNEAECLPYLIESLDKVLCSTEYNFEVIIIDDGSNDSTPQILISLIKQFNNLFFIRFSRNFGHQNALKAGLDNASGDAVISLDADMQHPVELIPEMIRLWEDGADIVNTRRKDISKGNVSKGNIFKTTFKRVTSALFYKVINRLSETSIEPGSADFRLLSRKVVLVLRQFRSSDLFFRGLIPWVGFNHVTLDYTPAERYCGKSKYTFGKMLNFAIQGITSFSVRPLYFAVYFGIALACIAFVYFPYALYMYFAGNTISGWTSLIMTIVFLGGIQLTVTGILGIYLGKLFIHSKDRPAYIISETNLT